MRHLRRSLHPYALGYRRNSAIASPRPLIFSNLSSRGRHWFHQSNPDWFQVPAVDTGGHGRPRANAHEFRAGAIALTAREIAAPVNSVSKRPVSQISGSPRATSYLELLASLTAQKHMWRSTHPSFREGNQGIEFDALSQCL